MGRSVYIDLGANRGDTIALETSRVRHDAVWGFEANPEFLPILTERFANDGAVSIIGKAAWIKDGSADLYLGHPLSSTLLRGKTPLRDFPQFHISYDQKVTVETVDFALWLFRNVSFGDDVVLKMDVEGAEYALLARLLDTGAIDLVRELRCEFHRDRFPISEGEHIRISSAVGMRTRLVRWK